MSTWYLRRSRRRFWKSGSDADKQAAYGTLYTALVTLSKLIAPAMPFLADELHQNLVCGADPSAPPIGPPLRVAQVQRGPGGRRPEP